MLNLWYSTAPFVLTMAFRGSAKSTLAEEAIILCALFREYRNILIIGESYARACDRLRAIKREFESNDDIRAIFGEQVGETWQEQKIVLSSGIIIQALGQGQSLRGVKHLDARPDLVFIDDLESEDTVATPEARDKLSNWVYAALLPAMDVSNRRIRIAATPLDPEALAVKLSKDDNWLSKTFPITYVDGDGLTQAMWPERYPLEWVEKEKQTYFRAGKSRVWVQEYECSAVDPASRIFTEAMVRCEPRVRTWEAVYAVYDPARTTSKSSATTGKVVGSWISNRLVIWEAAGELWKPDEIIADMFDVDTRYNPIAIGVEKDGLEEFIMQPLRAASVERGQPIPLRPLKAPKGKLDFIRGLQPFFKAREVIFAGDRQNFSTAIEQLMSFPTGRIDVPNALAYFLVMRPGNPIYDGFSQINIVDTLYYYPRLPVFLAVNATGSMTTGVLAQIVNGRMHILHDFAYEGDPGSNLHTLVEAASSVANAALTVYAPRVHFDRYDNLGFRAAAKAVPIALRRGGDGPQGREQLRGLIEGMRANVPTLRVSSAATWTLRAFAGGYARAQNKDEPEDNVYRVLMEGLEALAGTMRSGFEAADQNIAYATGNDGRKYMTTRGGTTTVNPSKSGTLHELLKDL